MFGLIRGTENGRYLRGQQGEESVAGRVSHQLIELATGARSKTADSETSLSPIGRAFVAARLMHFVLACNTADWCPDCGKMYAAQSKIVCGNVRLTASGCVG